MSIIISCNGIDIHEIVSTSLKDEYIVLGGVKIKNGYKFKSHSDGDIIIHSIIDAISPLLTGKDIGELFPDTCEKYKNINSINLLQKVMNIINTEKKNRFKILNLDITVIIDVVKISIIKEEIIKNLKAILNVDFITVKGKRSENIFGNKKFGVSLVTCNIRLDD